MIPVLLSIDRSGPVASAAVFGRDGGLLASVSLPAGPRGDAWPLVRDVLAAAHVGAQEIEAFVVGTGPGSFSGVRSALAIVSGMAAPDALPVRGVITAAALLRLWRRANPGAPAARLLGDARRGHVWCFDEPADVSALAHAPSDLRLYATVSAEPDPALPPLSEAFRDGRKVLLCDSVRMRRILAEEHGCGEAEDLPREFFAKSAEAIAAIFREGSCGPADPVYLHPAVVGKTVSEV